MGFMKDQFSAPDDDDIDQVVGLFSGWKGFVIAGVVVVALLVGIVMAFL